MTKEKPNDNLIAIRLNEEELKEFEEVKALLLTKGLYGEDSLTIKTCITITKNVIPSIFGGKFTEIIKRYKTLKPKLEKKENIPDPELATNN